MAFSPTLSGATRYDTAHRVLTGDYTAIGEAVVVVDKTVGAATAITLPASQAKSCGQIRELVVADGKGDANTNNITVTAAGTDTINGAATYVMSANYQIAILYDCGDGNWLAK